MSLFTLYLLTRFNSLGEYFCFLSIIAAGFAGIAFIAFLMRAGDSAYSQDAKAEKKEVLKVNSKYLKIFIFLGSILGFITSAIPTNRDAYLIMGGYYATNYIANSKEAKQLPDNIINAANSFLKEYAADAANQAVAEAKQAVKDAQHEVKGK